VAVLQQVILQFVAPQGRHDSRISVKFGKVLSPVPNFTLIREYLEFPTPLQKCQNYQLLRPAGANPLPDVCEIRRVYAGNRATEVFNMWCYSVGKLEIYRQNRDGVFSIQNFWGPLAPKLMVLLKKSREMQNCTDILYLYARFGGGDPPLHGGVRIDR